MARLRPYHCLIFVVCLAVQGAAAWPVVQSGHRGPDVVAIQDLLQARGHALASDGSFGPITRAAVKAFQAANSLPVDGIVGSTTWPKLIIYVRRGSRGRPVRAVQYLLAHKYNLLARSGVDSSFGPITHAAVISFQASKGLAQDGVVGPRTWHALISGNSGAGPSPGPPSPTSPTPCSSVTKSRDGVVAAARETVALGKIIRYTLGPSRWSGIRDKVCLPSVPTHADCSSFISWLFWMAYGNGEDFLNRDKWRWGWTGTLKGTGQPVPLSAAKPGDVVVYFNSSGINAHAAIYIGSSQVVNYGSTTAPKILSIDYFAKRGKYPTYDIRTYSEMV